MSALPVYLDVDPGHDDFFLILFSLFSQRANVLGISTVGGNQSLAKTTINTLNALNIFTNTNVFDQNDKTNLRDFDFPNIPVCPGAEASLIGDSIVCAEIHGESGLEYHDKSFSWPPLRNKALSDLHGVDQCAKTIRQFAEKHDEKVHLIATGRLTNIAMLFQKYPDIHKYIAQITIMGGSHKAGGNTGVTSEFNIQIDPEAAQVVFENGCSQEELLVLQTTQHKPSNTTTIHRVPIVLVPLDVTHTVLVTEDILTRISIVCHNHDGTNQPSPFGRLLVDLMTFFRDTYRDVFGFLSGPPLHDPVTFFYLLAVQHNISNKTVISADPTVVPDANVEYPPLFKTAHVRVDVDTSHGICRGTTAVDIHKVLKNGQPANVIVALETNVEAFWAHLLFSLDQANKQCILNQKAQ